MTYSYSSRGVVRERQGGATAIRRLAAETLRGLRSVHSEAANGPGRGWRQAGRARVGSGLRGWCLRTRSLREQINTAAPCTWTFLPLRRLVPSPFLSVFISRRFAGGACLLLSLSLSSSYSLSPSRLLSSPLLPFGDPYHALPPTQVIRNSTRFLPIFLVFPIGFSLLRSPGASLCLVRERIQLVLPTYTPRVSSPCSQRSSRRFLLLSFRREESSSRGFFPKARSARYLRFHSRLSWH